MTYDLRIVLGSSSDAEKANIILGILQRCGVSYGVSVCSCHRQAGPEFNDFIFNIEEKIIAYIGGMSFGAPGDAESVARNAKQLMKLFVSIPLDKTAMLTTETLPEGVPILTTGFNRENITHGLKNAGMALVKLAALVHNKPEILNKLQLIFDELGEKKKLVPAVELGENGLIPTNKKINFKEE